MKIALIQQVATPDLEANLQRGLDAARTAATNGARLIVFPELAFTPFYPQERLQGSKYDLAETIPGRTTDAFSAVALEYGVVIVLNLYEKSGAETFDSSPVHARIEACASASISVGCQVSAGRALAK